MHLWTPWLNHRCNSGWEEDKTWGLGRSRSAALLSPLRDARAYLHALEYQDPEGGPLHPSTYSCSILTWGEGGYSLQLVSNTSGLWERAWNIFGFILVTRNMQAVKHSPFPHMKHQTSSQISTWVGMFLCRFYNSSLKLIIHLLKLFLLLSFWN